MVQGAYNSILLLAYEYKVHKQQRMTMIAIWCLHNTWFTKVKYLVSPSSSIISNLSVIIQSLKHPNFGNKNDGPDLVIKDNKGHFMTNATNVIKKSLCICGLHFI